MRTAVVTDTNSSMSVQEGGERGIFVLPMPILIDNETFLEGETVSFEQVFKAMEKGKDVKTSQPSPGDVCNLWEKVLSQGYDELVYVPMSSGLSSSYQTACTLAKEFDGRVRVANNRRISLTLYESILDAKAMADAGASAEEICTRLEDTAHDATIYLTVDSLEYLKKGGRITAAVAAIGSLLRIKPVMTIQGERLELFGRVRGRAKAGIKMIAATAVDLERFLSRPVKSVLVGAAGTLTDPAAVKEWSDQIRRRFPEYPYLYHPLPCSIACHTGPGAFGTGFVCMDRLYTAL